jgi:hypothetical protein
MRDSLSRHLNGRACGFTAWLWGRKHQPAVFETDSAESTQINHVANDDDEE